MRDLTIVRGVLRTIGRPAILRATASFVAVGLPSTIVFGPQGTRAADLTRALHASLGLRLVLWTGWLVIFAPAAWAVFRAPGTSTLRALQLPARSRLAALVLLLGFGGLPWVLLFGRGEGGLAALGAITTAITIEAAAIARRPVGLGLGAVAALAVIADPPGWLRAALGVGLVLPAVEIAWRSAPESRRRRFDPRTAPLWRAIAAPSALVRLHWLRLARAESSRLLLALAFSALGGAGLLTLGSEDVARPIQRALAVTALPFVVVAAILAPPLVAAEIAIRPFLRSLSVRRALVMGAFLVALTTPTTALAATVSVAASACGSRGGVFGAWITFAVSGWVAILTFVVGIWAHRTTERSLIAFTVGIVLFGLAATVTVLAA